MVGDGLAPESVVISIKRSAVSYNVGL
jgi:hypothetical protein